MSALLLYHGSTSAVRHPCIERCRPHNDYGRGFYCTPTAEMAKEWACQKGTNGFVSCYELPLSGLTIVDLNKPEFTLLNWLEVLLDNRLVRLSTPTMQRGAQWLKANFAVDLSTADVVTGYRADDSYFGFARAFLRNEITFGQLSAAMRLGQLGTQYMMKSERAFAALRYIGCEPAEASIYWPLQVERENKARADFATMLEEAPRGSAAFSTESDTDSLYISDLMRLNWEDTYARLR
ncbi:DUF3990 domain-containing protein [Adlercreutzia sp. ZJ138]|uniref:DUF3990 domain-containing protein n=1 Tax=Adlercreutzia sp. ZJ138 TaxID=2709405 RepID=UPI0013ED0292|nr:DUF3990 domain-containing protein [Adlercreutzia sp. ZJ138]